VAATVTANLTRALLLRVAELMVDTPDALIASGLLEEEADSVAVAFAPLRERRRVRLHGWCALLLGG
jgi:ribosomal protein L11 methylase PrmA